MAKDVIVSGFDGDDGKFVIVVVTLNPIEAYASKDQKHVGWVKQGSFIPDKERKENLSPREEKLICQIAATLLGALIDITEVPNYYTKMLPTSPTT